MRRDVADKISPLHMKSVFLLKKREQNSPSRAAGDAGAVDGHAQRAGTITDGQGGSLGDGVGVCAVGDLGGGRAVGGVGGDDLGGVADIVAVAAVNGGGGGYGQGEDGGHGGEMHLLLLFFFFWLTCCDGYGQKWCE